MEVGEGAAEVYGVTWSGRLERVGLEDGVLSWSTVALLDGKWSGCGVMRTMERTLRLH